jgi:hypothetical protein
MRLNAASAAQACPAGSPGLPPPRAAHGGQQQGCATAVCRAVPERRQGVPRDAGSQASGRSQAWSCCRQTGAIACVQPSLCACGEGLAELPFSLLTRVPLRALVRDQDKARHRCVKWPLLLRRGVPQQLPAACRATCVRFGPAWHSSVSHKNGHPTVVAAGPAHDDQVTASTTAHP